MLITELALNSSEMKMMLEGVKQQFLKTLLNNKWNTFTFSHLGIISILFSYRARPREWQNPAWWHL